MPTRDQYSSRRGSINARINAHFLSNNTTWFTSRRIADGMGLDIHRVASHLSRLFRDGMLERSNTITHGRGYAYRHLAQETRQAEVQRRSAARPTERGFGVEIEFLFPVATNASRVAAMDLVASTLTAAGVPAVNESYNHSLRSHWKVVYDVSVRCNGHHGLELVSPILRGEDGERQLRIVCEKLQSLGCLVNRTCGLHVHHGAEEVDMATLEQFYSYYGRCEQHTDFIMPQSRRGSRNTYCQSNTAGAWSTTRYRKVNLQAYSRHRTCEYRHHAGTLDSEKIIHWVRLSRALLEGFVYDNVRTVNSDAATFFRSVNVPADTGRFFFNRFNHFARRENRPALQMAVAA